MVDDVVSGMYATVSDGGPAADLAAEGDAEAGEDQGGGQGGGGGGGLHSSTFQLNLSPV